MASTWMQPRSETSWRPAARKCRRRCMTSSRCMRASLMVMKAAGMQFMPVVPYLFYGGEFLRFEYPKMTLFGCQVV
jgi:hypothetical protein